MEYRTRISNQYGCTFANVINLAQLNAKIVSFYGANTTFVEGVLPVEKSPSKYLFFFTFARILYAFIVVNI